MSKVNPYHDDKNLSITLEPNGEAKSVPENNVILFVILNLVCLPPISTILLLIYGLIRFTDKNKKIMIGYDQIAKRIDLSKKEGYRFAKVGQVFKKFDTPLNPDEIKRNKKIAYLYFGLAVL